MPWSRLYTALSPAFNDEIGANVAIHDYGELHLSVWHLLWKVYLSGSERG